MTAVPAPQRSKRLPHWVPDAARHYLAHTERGLSIRALARANDCHPSTVLRQVRRFEGRRDDPLIDAALKSLSTSVSDHEFDQKRELETMNIEQMKASPNQTPCLTQSRIDQEAKRVLRRLCEQGAVLAVAHDMEMAVVVRETADGTQMRTGTVDREIAQAMALKDWIACPDPGKRVSKYFVTNAGRSALRRLTAEDENRAGGFSERRAEFDGDTRWDALVADSAIEQPARYYRTESPLIGLARRRDRDGEPFLKREFVAVGERLREDFELAQVDMPPVESLEALMSEASNVAAKAGSSGSQAARERLRAALLDLGPGLNEVAFRCCCLLEGLEQTEKKMGWSARSGKIVLRISLQRLARHYEETLGQFGPMIG